MGFALTVLYIVVTIISPEQFGPEWASYHALLYLAVITFVLSLPSILSNMLLRSSIQTFLLIGLTFAIALSEVANGWFGGIAESWQSFLPSAAVFFFIVANVTTIRRLKVLTLSAVASCLVVVVEALCGYYAGFRGELFVLHQNLYLHDQVVGYISRLQGAGFLNDPNDFAQMLLIVLPLLFVAWRRERVVANCLLVIVPAALLLWATYLTHSRGALIALAVLALMVARKRIGNTASVVLAIVLIMGMLAIDFTGGRGISAVDGSDRLEAWATGLELFKSAPLFGIGYGNFTDFNNITAHNSFVLCLAELGLVGSTIWVALLVTTMTGLNRIIEQQEKRQINAVSAAKAEQAEEFIYFFDSALCSYKSPATTAIATNTAIGVKTTIEPTYRPIVPVHWVMAMRLALVSFITTGWFLSRGYRAPMFLVLGVATATIALLGRASESRVRVGSRWFSVTLATEAAALICIYGLVRLRS